MQLLKFTLYQLHIHFSKDSVTRNFSSLCDIRIAFIEEFIGFKICVFLCLGIDPDEERNREEEIMLQDANQWLNNSQMQDTPHPKTGATSLHVAAAKGYIKVMQYVEIKLIS